MPPLQWFGTLEPRPSPIVQALNALQPGVDALAQWLRQQPERERQMLQALTEFVQSLPDERVVQQFLDTIPPERRAALVEMSQRHGIGGFSMTPEGRLQVAMPVQALQRQQEWRLRRAEELLAPILGAPDEQREAWVSSTEGQRTLQQVREFAPTLVIERQGRLEPVQNVDAILRRQLVGAQVESERAQAGLRRAQERETIELLPHRAAALQAEAATSSAQAQHLYALAERVRALTPVEVGLTEAQRQQTLKATEEVQARIDRVQGLLPEEKRQLAEQTNLIVQQAERLKLITPEEARQLRAQTNRIEQLTRAELDELRERARNVAAQTQRILTLTPLEARQLEANTNILVQTLRDMEAKHPYIAELAMAELRRLNAEAARIEQMTPVEIQRLQQEIAESAQRTQNLAFQLDYLKRTAPLQYRQLELEISTAQANLDRLLVTNEFLRPMMETQLQQMQTALQQDIEDLTLARETRPLRVAMLRQQLEQAVFTLQQLKERAPYELELLKQQVENARKEGSELDARAVLLAAQASLTKAQEAHLSHTEALAWAQFQHQVDQDNFNNALELRRQAFTEEITRDRQEFEKWLEKNKLEIERRRVDILQWQVGIEEKRAEQEQDWRVISAVVQADALAAIELMREQGLVSPGVQNALVRSLKRETTMKAAQIAGAILQDLIAAGRVGEGNELTAWTELTRAIAGEFFDADGFSKFVGATQQNPANPEKVAKDNPGDAWVAGLSAIATAGGIPVLLATWELWKQLGPQMFSLAEPLLPQPGGDWTQAVRRAFATPALPPTPTAPMLPQGAATPALPPPGQTSVGRPIPATRLGRVPLGQEASRILLPQGDVIELPSKTWIGKIPKGTRFIDLSRFRGGLSGVAAGLTAAERGFLMPGEIALVWLNQRSGGRLGWLLNVLGVPPEMQGVQQR